jgi:hypothetical protein
MKNRRFLRQICPLQFAFSNVLLKKSFSTLGRHCCGSGNPEPAKLLKRLDFHLHGMTEKRISRLFTSSSKMQIETRPFLEEKGHREESSWAG